MNLEFKEEDGKFVSVFNVTGDFNLHLEQKGYGVVSVLQSIYEQGPFDVAKDFQNKVINCDFGALVYPKWIKVVSSSEVINAVVTFATV